MNFATWSIRNPIPAILLFLLLTLAGSGAFARSTSRTFRISISRRSASR
jgi:multidrug efflux pump subunit AcrB